MHEKPDDDALRRGGGYIARKDQILVRMEVGNLERCRWKSYPLLRMVVWCVYQRVVVSQTCSYMQIAALLGWSHDMSFLCFLFSILSSFNSTIPWYMFGFKDWFHGTVVR